MVLNGFAMEGIAEKTQLEEVMKRDVNLTEDQKEELARLHKQAIEKQKQIITKYVEYGVITEEKGQKMIEKTDKYFKQLEEHNYIPRWEIKTH
jgi:ElaB/YqjD/DUF883 family membrane-anchored ribosome-binding protein